MANAYGAGRQQDLWQSAEGAFKPTEREFFHQRRHTSTALIQTSDGTLLVRPGDGGLMGDSNEPDLFMKTFYVGTKQWLFNNHKEISHPMVARWEHVDGPQDG